MAGISAAEGERQIMKGMALVGVVLIVLGVAGLIVQNVTVTEEKEVLDIGPLEVQTEQERNIPIPTIAGIVAVIAGLGLVLASRRSS
jgi:hypothetical protein